MERRGCRAAARAATNIIFGKEDDSSDPDSTDNEMPSEDSDTDDHVSEEESESSTSEEESIPMVSSSPAVTEQHYRSKNQAETWSKTPVNNPVGKLLSLPYLIMAITPHVLHMSYVHRKGNRSALIMVNMT
jgi:hypothetical protein